MVNEATRSMSEDENCEGIDSTYDPCGFDLSHSLSIKVEYYRSFEYTLTCTAPMPLQRFSRVKTSRLEEEVAPRPLKSQGGRSVLKKKDTNESEDCDIIDVIDKKLTTDYMADQEATRDAVCILDSGLDQSNDEADSECSNSSIVSGPSTHWFDKQEQLYYNLCTACQTLYEKAKRLKKPIQSKLLDNDPKSLTCDQWVLMKKWNPRRLPNARQKLLSHLQLDGGVAKWKEQHFTPCSRPHTFLQRNLRRTKTLAEMKKKNKRKRRGNSQGSRVAKQKCVQNNDNQQRTNIKRLVENRNSCFSSCSNLKDCSRAEMERQVVKDVNFELVPPATRSAEVRAQEMAPKKTSDFIDLLTKLQQTSSRIIREKS